MRRALQVAATTSTITYASPLGRLAKDDMIVCHASQSGAEATRVWFCHGCKESTIWKSAAELNVWFACPPAQASRAPGAASLGNTRIGVGHDASPLLPWGSPHAEVGTREVTPATVRDQGFEDMSLPDPR